MKKSFPILTLALFIIVWSCSRENPVNNDLKQSVEQSINKIDEAVSDISAGKGYQMMCANIESGKSVMDFNDSISVGMVSGVYNFKPDMTRWNNFVIPYRIFKKVGESESIIVSLPQKLVFHPKYLHAIYAPDSILENDFTINATDYHLYYTLFKKYDYKLDAGFMLNGQNIGSLNILVSGIMPYNHSYTSAYTFAEGYNIVVSMESGDTTTTSFALGNEDEIMMKETIVTVGEGFVRKEAEYILTIGNIEIRRDNGTDINRVFLDGIEQKEAGVVVYDGAGTDGSILQQRDIQMTFDDGTILNLSELLNPLGETLGTLVDSMHSMSFANNVVNYIALSIYYYSLK